MLVKWEVPDESNFYSIPYDSVSPDNTLNGGTYTVTLKNVSGTSGQDIWVRSTGTYEGVTQTIQVYAEIVNVTPWNNAIFAGAGASGSVVNGNVDVVFDTVNNFAYVSPISGLTTNIDLSLASFDPISKTCSSVECHIEETEVIWGLPYRWMDTYECDRCHNFNQPDCIDCHAP